MLLFCTGQMIEAMNLRRDVIHSIARAASACQLSHDHRHKLQPAGCGSKKTAGVVLFGKGLEFIYRHKLQYLGEDHCYNEAWTGYPCYSTSYQKIHCINRG